jgi:hypothetical protein
MPRQTMRIRLFVFCAASAALGAGALRLTDARAQGFVIDTSAYARLQITGDDALLFTQNRIVRFAGDDFPDELPIENARARAIVPPQIIHLNNAAREGWEVIGPVDPDANEFLLRRR